MILIHDFVYPYWKYDFLSWQADPPEAASKKVVTTFWQSCGPGASGIFFMSYSRTIPRDGAEYFFQKMFCKLTRSIFKILSKMPMRASKAVWFCLSRITWGKVLCLIPRHFTFRAKSALGYNLVLHLVVTSESCHNFWVQKIQFFCLQLSTQAWIFYNSIWTIVYD